MDLSITDYLLVGLAIFVSNFIQASVGFGSGLVAIPLMLFAGIDLSVAVTVNLLTSTVQNILGLRKHWQAVDWNEIRQPIALRIGGLPLGVLALFLFNATFGDDKTYIRVGVGVIILITLATQVRKAPEKGGGVPRFWSFIAFPLSGMMQGFIGMAGPPMVIWVIAQNWTPNKSRAFLFIMLLATAPLHFVLFAVIWPHEVVLAMFLFAVTIPAPLLASPVGLFAGKFLSKTWLRRISYTVLILIAGNCLLEPLF